MAFIDVLGFSNYSERDLQGALTVLSHQQMILDGKLVDGASHPASSYADPDLARLAEAHLIDSFEQFLPFSDSTFIVGTPSDKFLRQLAHFLIESLEFVGNAYSRAHDPSQPERVEVRELVTGTRRSENWYPPLWRGGLAVGTLHTFTVAGVTNGKRTTFPNVAGPAVVKAAKLERSGPRGPRLLCEHDFAKQLESSLSPYFRQISPSLSELLWPAFVYESERHHDVAIHKFNDLWQPAITLWKSQLHQPAFEHYDEFLRLLIRSFVQWGNAVGCATETQRVVSERVREDIGEDLVDAYLR